MQKQQALKEKMTGAPKSPGVYIMMDAQQKVIYVGKANDLRSRIGSYFTGRDTRPMAPFLMARVDDIEFITTATEKEALILENNLIKKHRPRYNVILRDDKTYYHLRIDPADRYPRLQLVRKKLPDAALYFGPYPSGLAAKETLRFVQQIFPLRTCRDRDFHLRSRPCLQYQIGRCLAPCKGLIEEDAYRKLAQSVVSFLQGRRRELVADLKRQMEEAAESLHYEEAARLRDRIAALTHALEKQHVDWGDNEDQDAIGIHADRSACQVCILFVRDGKLLGSKAFVPFTTRADEGEVLSSVLSQYYEGADIPDAILLPQALSDEEVIAQWLAEKKAKKVLLTVPQRGAKKALVDMASANARETLAVSRQKENEKEAALAVLRDKLALSGLPRRIECYDISNIGGKHAVGSMVVFQDGRPDKSGYRRFRIQKADEPDDYGMMREVLTRRFQGPDPRPDLVVVDGGKGQLNVALAVFADLNIRQDVVGLAKEERVFFAAKKKLSGKGVLPEDRVYLPGRKDAVYLSSRPAALSILQQVRDEAHRFAVRYHRRLREKNDLISVLDRINDIGPERKKALLAYFGSAAQVKKATPADLQKVPGIGKELAEKIHQALEKQ